ncbi:DUF2490 domain-containing protein [Hymenobacter aerilatus]|uniref:DUF2490 domain-containing protein n=1 Tax=Hymenobacter aerilatus TaxID=2932251 RepID=A0A8T9T086_9BACT|nr:DUF2490 domain-containing protein [Hymenobacter aerilatus]UOR05449.1 DUF2490 domain-containing protein [Hymenobacter aerilatus]
MQLSIRLSRSVLLLLSMLLSGLTTSFGQVPTTPTRLNDPNFNAWLMFFSDARLSQRWGVHTEAQWRRYQGVRRPQQDFVRAAANYYVNDALMLSAGYAYALTHRYGEHPAASRFPEHRLYQQVLLRDNLGRVQLQHRYRQEQRWVRFAGDDAYSYLNRSRYQLRLAVPLTGTIIQAQTPYLAAYNEVFVGFGRNVTGNVFDQNRTYFAFGYQLSAATAVETGYLYQVLQQRNGQVFEHNHTLQLGLIYNPDWRRTTAD